MTIENRSNMRLRDYVEISIFTSEREIRKQFLTNHPLMKTTHFSIKDTKTVFNVILLDEGSF